MKSENQEVLVERELDCDEKENLKFDVLTKGHIWAYGVGHLLNDLCAACWFNYLLIYLKSINPIIPNDKDLTSTFAGYAMLGGQVADAISNPIVGIYSDKTKTAIGRRKPWYLGGTIMVNICFLFIFRSCLFCEWFGGGNGMALFYFILFPSLFNVGWSAVQISHMALVPSLSSSRKMRDKLSSLRNTFTYFANFGVLVIALIVFAFMGSDDNSKDNSSTILAYEIIVYILLGIGDLTSVFFFLKIDEPYLTKECSRLLKEIKIKLNIVGSKIKLKDSKIEVEKFNEDNKMTEQLIKRDKDPSQTSEVLSEVSEVSDRNYEVNISRTGERRSSIKLSRTSTAEGKADFGSWFRKAMFYQYGFAYMGMRVLINVATSMLQFYIVYVLEISSEEEIKKKIPLELAIIPMILYLFSVLGSFSVDKIFLKIGRKKTLVIAVVLIIVADVFLFFLSKSTAYLMYPTVAILGVGQAFSLNTSYSMIAEVIGQKGNESAFVFGCYSFAEKLMNGILLFVIMNSALMASNDPAFIRAMIIYVPTGACLFAAILIFFGKAKDYKTIGEKTDHDDFVE